MFWVISARRRAPTLQLDQGEVRGVRLGAPTPGSSRRASHDRQADVRIGEVVSGSSNSFSAPGFEVQTPSGPRKSRMPESVEMPAPVST